MFRNSSRNEIIGALATNCAFELDEEQKSAWLTQIDLLQAQLPLTKGHILFEFDIPRMGRRVDVVLLLGSVVLVIEFKVRAVRFDRAAMDQAWDYALDLKNFHLASHNRLIVPLVVATEAHSCPDLELRVDSDGVGRPLRVTPTRFREAIEFVLSRGSGTPIDGNAWLDSPYRPTPTIVEAARALYAQHSVEEIARHDAGAENLAVTSHRLEAIIDEAKRERRKVICFVTGVPGAGKTLVGLNVATRRQETDAASHAVYLSGNQPLVDVLREALARDEVARSKAEGKAIRKGDAMRAVKQFIQNVHHFRTEGLVDPGTPTEHVAIFDEAQRAWTRQKLTNWLKRRKGIQSFAESEPEFLLSTMDRHVDWGVVVCLVGEGQEINEGEAGIDEWLKATQTRFPTWRMHISSRLTDSEYEADRALNAAHLRAQTSFDDCLHLSVSMRSFRAERVSAFVKALLDRDIRAARSEMDGFVGQYPIVMTRDLDAAKEWVRGKARGSERYGLLASSKALRLRPHAVDVRVDVDPVKWFLNEREDIRSSYYLEDAATQFQVQGLELDWTCVTWDADLRSGSRDWSFHDFVGPRWQNVKSVTNRRYLLNAYRVLLDVVPTVVEI